MAWLRGHNGHVNLCSFVGKDCVEMKYYKGVLHTATNGISCWKLSDFCCGSVCYVTPLWLREYSGSTVVNVPWWTLRCLYHNVPVFVWWMLLVLWVLQLLCGECYIGCCIVNAPVVAWRLLRCLYREVNVPVDVWWMLRCLYRECSVCCMVNVTLFVSWIFRLYHTCSGCCVENFILLVSRMFELLCVEC